MSRTADPSVVQTHLELMQASLARQRERGKQRSSSLLASELVAYLDSGVAEIFRAHLDGSVVFSIVVLSSREMTYYHSDGAQRSYTLPKERGD